MKYPAYPHYRPSGIEWIGEIPKHWVVRRLKSEFFILNGSTPKSGEQDYWDGDIHWVTPDDLGSLEGDTIRTTKRTITKEGYKSCGTSLAPAGSIILSTRAVVSRSFCKRVLPRPVGLRFVRPLPSKGGADEH